MAAEDLSNNNQDDSYTKIIVNELEILDLLHDLQESTGRFLVWKKQINPKEIRVRVVTGILSSNLVENDVVLIDLTSGNKLVEYFGEEKFLFCFNPDKNLLFKAEIKDINVTKVVLSFPTKVNIISTQNVKIILPELDDPQLKKVFGTKKESKTSSESEATKNETLSPDEKQYPAENSSLTEVSESTDSGAQPEITKEMPEAENESIEDYTAIRSAPRGKASGDQVIEVIFTSGPNTGEKGYYELFDLSVGGLSFIVFDEAEIQMGTTLNITNLGGNEKRPPLRAEAVSFSELDATSGEYKVGLKFNN